MILKRLALALALAATLCAPTRAAERKPIVIGATGQQQQIQSTDTLKLPAATTANASINIPHGTAPASPTNGDCWTTTAGLFCRINGATVGPLISASGVTPGGSSGQIQYNSSGAFAGGAVSGDCTAVLLAFTCTKLNGVSPGSFFTGTDAANLTGTLSASRVAANSLALGKLAQVGGNSYLGNTASTTGDVTAYVWPSCTASDHALHYNPVGAAGLQCDAIGTVATGANPFFIGVPDIKSGVGAPSASSDPVGSIYLRTDTAELYQQYIASGQVPAAVQAGSVYGNTVTLGATPAAGDLLVGVCYNRSGINTGWTDSGVGGSASGSGTPINDRVVYKFAVSGESTSQAPCTGASAATVFEVSGVPNWTAAYVTTVSSSTTGGVGGAATLNYTTASANDLVLATSGSERDTPFVDPGAETWSGLSGTLSSAHGGGGGASEGWGVGTGSQAYASSSSSVSATVTAASPPLKIRLARLIILKPGDPGWQRIGNIINLLNQGTSITTRPLSINFSTGLTATDDGLGNTTVTNAGGTVTTSGSPVSGNLTKFSGATAITSGDLSGDCATAGTLAVVCLKTNGTSFGYFATGTDAANLTGTVSVNRFSSGTNADSSHYLRGDGTWATVSASLAAISADSILANLTGSSAAPVGNALPSCSGSNDALTYDTSTHALGCHAPAGAGGGTVTSVATGAGLTGGTITGSGTLALSGATIPQGRLTLVSATPVLTSDQTAKTTLYYDCYAGKLVPYYDGTTDQVEAISSCEVSTAMQASSTGVLNSAGVFDVWWVHGGASRICVATNNSGGGWASDTGGSNTARGTGYSQVHNTRGYWTNVNSITHCYNGATDYGSVSADQATYLGSLYTTAAGQTGMAFKPTAASGGTNNILGLWNAYNRVGVSALVRPSDATWATSGTGTWQTMLGTSFRFSWVDGLAQSTPRIDLNALPSVTAAGVAFGTACDSTTAAPQVTAQVNATVTVEGTVTDTCSPALGFHYGQAMQVQISSGTTTFNGAGTTPTRQFGYMRATLEMHLPPILPLAVFRRRRRRAANDNGERRVDHAA